MDKKELISEYVKLVLSEDDGGGDWGGGYGGIEFSDAAIGPFGAHFGSGGQLYNIFMEPFVNVFKTASGKTKELSKKVQTLGKVAFQTVKTTLLPMLKSDYEKIFVDEKKEIDKIREDYKDVYQSNWDVFADHDVLMLAFAYSPVMFLTSGFVRRSPRNAARMIGVLAGGALDPFLGRVAMRYGWNNVPNANVGGSFGGRHGRGYGGYGGYGDYGGGYGGSHGGSYDSGGDYGGAYESVIREKDEKKKKAKVSPEKLLTSKKVIDTLKNSERVQKMQRDAQTIVRGALKKVYDQAKAVLSAGTLAEMQKNTGAKFKGLQQVQQMPANERQKFEQALLKGTKDSMKEFLCTNLEGQVKQALDSGVPETSPFVTDYRSVVQKIKEL
jgi:hypothetical protein